MGTGVGGGGVDRIPGLGTEEGGGGGGGFCLSFIYNPLDAARKAMAATGFSKLLDFRI